jgi:death on curing protein
MTDYLTMADVLAIHQRLITGYGGHPGLRDAGALEAALYRPQSGYYQTLLAEAAALWESLCQNHPFVDGNKRVAFAATHVFLQMNGMQLTAKPAEIIAFIDRLFAEGNFNSEKLYQWLEANARSDKRP